MTIEIDMPLEILRRQRMQGRQTEALEEIKPSIQPAGRLRIAISLSAELLELEQLNRVRIKLMKGFQRIRPRLSESPFGRRSHWRTPAPSPMISKTINQGRLRRVVVDAKSPRPAA
jgi:hypothetical protein